MTSTADEKDLFGFIQGAPLEECAQMGADQWKSWGAWLLDHPWMLQLMHDGLMQEGFTPSQCEHALSGWLSQSLEGYSSVSTGHIESQEALTWWQVEMLDRKTGDPTVCHLEARHAPILPSVSGKSAQECQETLLHLERYLLLFCPEAPVLVATHHPQIDNDEPDIWPEDMSLAPCAHLAIESFVSSRPCDRMELMERDSEASDCLAEDMMAPDKVRSHPGPFYYTCTLRPPAAPLMAMRSKLQMLNTTEPAPRSCSSGPRL